MNDLGLVKEWLNRGVLLDQAINATIRAKECAMDAALRVTSAPSQDVRVKGSHGNTAEDGVIRLVDYEWVINQMVDRLYDITMEIAAVISLVQDDRMRMLLTARYVERLTWRSVADRVGLCVATTRGRANDYACGLAAQHIVQIVKST